MSKRSSKNKPKSFSEAIGIKDRLESDTVNFLVGLAILALAVYLVIAMVSYLATGQADQSLLESLQPADFFNTNHEFSNTCSSLGAIVAYFLITINFGLPAFAIPVFLILAALKRMKVCTSLNLLKWFFCLAFAMIWLSAVLAKFIAPLMGAEVYNPGGMHGLLCVQRIEDVVGTPGLVAILIVTAIAFLTYLSHETIEVVRKVLNPVKYFTDKIKVTVNNHPVTKDGELQTDIVEPDTIEDEANDKKAAKEPNEESMPNVVDLTDLSQFEAKPKPETHTNEPQAMATTGQGDEPAEMTVEKSKDEPKASGSKTTVLTDLDTPINPWEPFTKYKFPTLNLLKKYDSKPVIDMEEIKSNNARIVEVLKSFGVEISKINATVGPTVTLYEITPAEGVRISKIRGLEADIALSLSALGIRIIAPIPGKGTIGIEVPNKKPQIVSMESVLNTKKFQDTKMALPMALGKTITNEVFMVDLAKLPHLLVAGATGQGKSVGLNAIITSLLYKKHPNELKFVLVDPKKVEFSIYNKIAPHYMAALPENEDEPIITDVQKVVRTLNSLCKLMDHRYDMLKLANVKKIDEYNDKFIHHKLRLTDGHEYMPYIVVVIDEFGDLIMTAGKEIEAPIARIAQLARAVGIHMIIATQRPTTRIITGNIKANFPGRMAFRVASQIDSRTILDRTGADQLVGRGDMLFLGGGEPVRVQCAFIDTPEIEAVNDFIAAEPGPVDAMELPEPDDPNAIGAGGGIEGEAKNLDPYFDEAAHAIVISQQGSTSMIQRRFSIGYNRAGRLMDQLEKAGIVGAAQGSKPREVLLQDEASLNVLLARIHGA
mgnify:FL=1